MRLQSTLIRSSLAALMLLLGSLLAAQPGRAQEPFAFAIEGERAKVTFVQGEVRRQPAAGGQWAALPLGAFVQAGERIKTLKGARLELQLPDNSVTRFDEETDVRLVRAAYDQAAGKRDVKFAMFLGKTWANIQRTFGTSAGVQVEADNAVVGVRGTVFRMNVGTDGTTTVKVYRGSVTVKKPERVAAPSRIGSQVRRVPGPTRVAGPHRVTMEEWVKIVEAMQQIVVSPEGVPSDPRPFTMAEDLNDWVEWNLERDRLL